MSLKGIYKYICNEYICNVALVFRLGDKSYKKEKNGVLMQR